MTACPPAWLDSVSADGSTPTVHPVATAWNDLNVCSACDCEPDPDAGCADAKLALYTDPDCKTVAAQTGPGVCAALIANVQSAQYSATAVHAGCTVVAPPQPTGIESSFPDAGYVVCCAQ